MCRRRLGRTGSMFIVKGWYFSFVSCSDTAVVGRRLDFATAEGVCMPWGSTTRENRRKSRRNVPNEQAASENLTFLHVFCLFPNLYELQFDCMFIG